MVSATKRAAITGASSGIGELFARRLAKDGWALTLIARSGEKLAALAETLQNDHGVESSVLSADLTKPDELERVATTLAADEQLEMLINNAGFGQYVPLVEVSEPTLQDMVMLNVWALTRLTRAVLPGMLSRDRGAIINVSSGLSFTAMPTRATYSASKAYVNTFTQSIAEEITDSNVKLQILCPTITRTPFHDVSGTDLGKVPPHLVMEAEPVVEASLKALEMNELFCIPALQETGPLEDFLAARDALNNAMRQTNQPAPRYR